MELIHGWNVLIRLQLARHVQPCLPDYYLQKYLGNSCKWGGGKNGDEKKEDVKERDERKGGRKGRGMKGGERKGGGGKDRAERRGKKE